MINRYKDTYFRKILIIDENRFYYKKRNPVLDIFRYYSSTIFKHIYIFKIPFKVYKHIFIQSLKQLTNIYLYNAFNSLHTSIYTIALTVYKHIYVYNPFNSLHTYIYIIAVTVYKHIFIQLL